MKRLGYDVQSSFMQATGWQRGEGETEVLFDGGEESMTKTPRLSPSGIEYLTHTWNFGSGCSNFKTPACPLGEHCWAYQQTKRYPALYPNGFKPTLYPEAFLSPLGLKKPARIGVCFMGDLFCDGFDPCEDFNGKLGKDEADNLTLKGRILDTIEKCPQHTFVFLTKNPAGLLRWSPFQDNCWVGFSACNREMLLYGLRQMKFVDAAVKFVFIEPMLQDDAAWCLPFSLVLAGVKWVIIGAQTKPYRPPTIGDVEAMVEVADIAGAKVFLKNNLAPLLAMGSQIPVWAADSQCGYYCDEEHGHIDHRLRQELPSSQPVRQYWWSE